MEQSDKEARGPNEGLPRDGLDADVGGTTAETTPEKGEGAAESVEGGAEVLAELQAKADERDLFLDQLRRKTAELDNYQKRVRRERPAWEEQAVSRFVRALLPVVDNFDRALESIEGGGANQQGLEEGVRLIHQMLRLVLTENGIEEISAAGQLFDPEWHEALVQEPVEDRPTGEIVEVLEKGYRLRASILRPSKVKVALNVKDCQARESAPGAEEAASHASEAEDEKG